MSQGEINDYAKDLQDLTNTVAGNIDEGAQKFESFFSSARIYRVPEDLRKLKESAYTPRLIAIGPLHRNDSHLQTPFQNVKKSYTKSLLSRSVARIEDQLELAEQKRKLVLQECLVQMKTSIDDIKKCYAEEVTVDEEMMLVDGCFILEFLYRDFTSDVVPERDPILSNNLTFSKVKNDLVLLENQIPFFVLEKLFHLTVRDLNNNRLLTDYIQDCYHLRIMREQSSNDNSSTKSTWSSPSDCVLGIFGCTTTAKAPEEVQSGIINDHHSTPKYYHILHTLHDVYVPPKPKSHSHIVVMPSASELAYAGVEFVPDTSGNTLFKINFVEPNKGLFWWCRMARFEIPRLEIDDRTESYLRNLIALEQCCPDVSQHVSSYAWLMDILVNSDKDMQVLENAGVVSNFLGTTDATALLSKLCKECIVGDYFLDTSIRATNYSKRFWPKNMALLKRTYFGSPWTFIAFCVGFIAFVISLVQFARDFNKKG